MNLEAIQSKGCQTGTSRWKGAGAIANPWVKNDYASSAMTRMCYVFLEDSDISELALGQEVLSAESRPRIADFHAVSPPLTIQPLILSGKSANRIDLVFFADGYTAEERPKFLEDARRLAQDISSNQTFNTVKPLMNFWAAFTPSVESGIGVGGKPKNTAFGLYRDGTELRGVYYSKPDEASAACFSMGDRCDYPILMGNDPLYGGLGGDFTVITPSLANGALVLRHELGHSIIDVGEEYDGGYAYFGVNAVQDLSSDLPWKQWLSEPLSDSPRVERSVMPMQNYAWTMLNTSEPWSVTFNSSGMYDRYLLRFSLSGVPEKQALSVEFDDQDLGWTPRKDIGVDRWHYDIHKSAALEEGLHQVKFTLKDSALEGTAQLCSVEVLEFGTEKEFNSTPAYYGLFPTFSEQNETTYRPTNEDCLMRQVTTPNFCSVCREGLWRSLLRRVHLVDDVYTGCAQDASTGKWTRTIELYLVPLAQFRRDPVTPQESYAVTWSKGGQILEEFTNRTSIVVDDEVGVTYDISVEFSTEEVRTDRDGYLKASGELTLSSKCDG
ncbi:hypothetical protein GLOTRDRAFT_139285 [Gloeophyllum trabeum ATCC 11539]|uniref:IgA peptidase M64 n=1 Tax=Gloeophyllum trabeum (strain ATCC 11539 / FP-39264 / Madison 617) TaxID=670483 RepID=S7RK68_GLOTA|nr:uncharacterized protein GLOTRDRAFT_139285 [Gloeophyllum trabeum ATCC 11539]EPQ54790.1 hypothetical protein GLOTRDRAFT_139285 [Gloeophyllum trabeum ATCC 11539]